MAGGWDGLMKEKAHQDINLWQALDKIIMMEMV